MTVHQLLAKNVHYVLTANDAAAINRRRVHNAAEQANWPAGAQSHVGNQVWAGEQVAMTIVKEWSEVTVNGQLLLDGNDSYWVTSATYSAEATPGT